MSEVVDHLAELTGFRDRDVMDVTLVAALRDLLEPLSVGIFRCVGEAGQERWLTRAHLCAGEAVASADPLWSDPATLPPAQAYPLRVDCMRNHSIVQVRDKGQWLTLFPIITERDVVGVLEISSADVLPNQSQRMVCSVLRIYHNFQGLLDYSERDTLTGLLNRRTFDESFLKAVSGKPTLVGSTAPLGRRQLHDESQYWLGLIDIDHFKLVNDSFGHLIGDEVLLLLSRLMRNSFRFHDLLYRFGGEEFVVLMRCESEDHANQAFERLRLNTEQYQFPQVGRITVSVGFARVRAGDTPATAFDRADKAVYYAKGSGRNQVCSHAALIESGQMEDHSQVNSMELF